MGKISTDVHAIGVDLLSIAGHKLYAPKGSVLRAMKVPLEWARETLRFSTGKMTTETEIDKAIHIIADAVIRFKNK